MSHIDGTMIFKLEEPIRYNSGGDFVEAEFIEFYEFGIAHERESLRLMKTIDKCITDFSLKAEARNKSDRDAGLIVENPVVEDQSKELIKQSDEDHSDNSDDMYEFFKLALNMSDDDDILYKFINTFKSLVVKSEAHAIGKLDGKRHVNVELWSKFGTQVKLEVAIRYCSFFGIGSLSLMKDELETASEPATEVKEL